jgi:hydrogenase nickel incorporation protein HypB
MIMHLGLHEVVPPADPTAAGPRTVSVRQGVLLKNDAQAHLNRALFRAKGVLAVNVLASPGAGKTTLLQRTLTDLGGRLPAAVVVGDLATDNDARRLRVPGVEAVQVTTGTVCHLEAAMVARACQQLHLDGRRLLFIENVGNLVCPAAYDLGEAVRVVLLSVTEGEDKPLKYPKIFKTADAVAVTKTDLAAAAGFDRAAALANVRAIAPQAAVFELSARTGDGLAAWYAYLEGQAVRPGSD